MPTRVTLMPRLFLAGLAGLAALAAASWVPPAAACGRAPPALIGQPKYGETNVPTDAVPFYDDYLAWLDLYRGPATPFVLTSSTGDVVPTTPVRRRASTFELTPERPLAPHTTYTLRGTWPVPSGQGPMTTVDLSLTFTSGAGPYDKELSAPVAGVQHYQLVDSDGTLTGAGSCIYYSGDLPIEATFFTAGSDAGTQIGPLLYDRPFDWNLSGILQHTDEDCVSLRLRAPNGTMSAPMVVCRDDGRLIRLSPNGEFSCSSRGIRPDIDAGAEPDARIDGTARDATPDASAPSAEYPVGSAASCSIIGLHRHQPSAWGLLAGLSLLAARFRRRRLLL